MDTDKVKFKINDHIMYGRVGVCIVKNICIPHVNCIDTSKVYYMLEPLYSKGSTIYTPVNNSKVTMRKIMTKEEAQKFVVGIPLIAQLEIDETRKPEEQYKENLYNYNCQDLVSIIKSLYQRKAVRATKSKAISLIDERYFNMAKDLLYGELSVSLEIPKDNVESYIISQISDSNS